MHRSIAAVGTGLALAVTVAACGSSTHSAAPAASSPAPAPATSSASGTSGSSDQATTITATETEFHIALSSMPTKPGTYTFKVDNAGKTTHALTIDGPGVSDKGTSDIAPGSSASVTVTLKAGKYDVFCPVANHKMLGMNVDLTVA